MEAEDRVLLIVPRDKPMPHYEFHFDKKVVFATLKDGEFVKVGESSVERVS